MGGVGWRKPRSLQSRVRFFFLCMPPFHQGHKLHFPGEVCTLKNVWWYYLLDKKWLEQKTYLSHYNIDVLNLMSMGLKNSYSFWFLFRWLFSLSAIVIVPLFPSALFKLNQVPVYISVKLASQRLESRPEQMKHKNNHKRLSHGQRTMQRMREAGQQEKGIWWKGYRQLESDIGNQKRRRNVMFGRMQLGIRCGSHPYQVDRKTDWEGSEKEISYRQELRTNMIDGIFIIESFKV